MVHLEDTLADHQEDFLAVASVEVAAADLAVAAEAASAEDAEKPKPLTQNEKHVCLAGVLFLTLIAA